jgi:DNA mismatch repair ATPase MutS
VSASIDEGFDNRFVLVYVRNAANTSIGFTFFDLTILKFYSGSIKSKKMNLMHKFRTLLMQVRPLECVALHSELQKDTAKLIKGI